ncbi:MAG: hypothetical protein IH599_01420 [Bacteroidales bacterium]|nr:hypothetical protein [Bacteroidales bacterium]
MTTSKPRIVKDYDRLPEDIINRVKLKYPDGFVDHLVSYTDKEGKKVSALPFDTDEVYYLIRMTASEARQIIEDDDDYDEAGMLRDDFAVDTFGEDDSDVSSDDDDYDEDDNEPADEDGGEEDEF